MCFQFCLVACLDGDTGKTSEKMVAVLIPFDATSECHQHQESVIVSNAIISDEMVEVLSQFDPDSKGEQHTEFVVSVLKAMRMELVDGNWPKILKAA